MNWIKVKDLLHKSGLIVGGTIFFVQLISRVINFNPGQISSRFWETTLWSVIGMALVVGFQILNWGFLLRGLCVNIPFSELSKGYVLSSMPKYIPGSIWGYLSRSQWMNKDYHVAYNLTNLANILEIEITFVSAGVVLLISFNIRESSIDYVLGVTILALAALFLIQLIVSVVVRKGWIYYSQFPGQLVIHFPFIIIASFISMVEWIILGVITLLLLQSVDTSLTLVGERFNLKLILLAVESFTLAWLGGFLVILVPGGLGIRELALARLLTTNFSTSVELAGFAAILSRIFYSLGEILWLLVGLLLRWLPKNKKNNR